MKLPIKAAKSDFRPHRKVVFLGFMMNALDLSILIPSKKLRQVRKQVNQALLRDKQQRLTQGILSTTIGQLIALLPACREGLLHSLQLFRIQTMSVHHWGWLKSAQVRLDSETKAELNWWKTFLQQQRSRPTIALQQSLDLAITATDSSDHTIAGVLLSDRKLPHYSRTLSRRERRLHINVKECLAVWEMIQNFPERLRGKHVNFRIDSMAVVHALNKWGTRQTAVIPILQKIFNWALATRTVMTATYVNTRGNVMADRLSRRLGISRQVRAETLLFAHSIQTSRRHDIHWCIRPKPLRKCFQLMRIRPRRNLTNQPIFTTEAPMLLPRNATTANFRRNRLFSFPALNRIPKTLQAIQKLGIQVHVMLPLWMFAPWMATAARMMTSRPVVLEPQSITQFHQRIRCKNTWKWIGLQLSGAKKHRLEFRRKLRSSKESEVAPFNNVLPDGTHCVLKQRITISKLQMLLQIQKKTKF
jgi:hypothetical protein